MKKQENIKHNCYFSDQNYSPKAAFLYETPQVESFICNMDYNP